jgi:uncharacterized protein
MLYKTKFDRIMAKVRKVLRESPRCHAWDHTERVMRNARRLAAMEKKCDAKVVELGALLHDIARADEMAAKGKTMCHAKRGGKIAEEMLVKEQFPEEVIDRVVACVERHRYRSSNAPKTLEEKIVYDADKLDSIGAIGLARSFHFSGHIGSRIHNTREEALGSKSYSREDTAYREFLVKQCKIPSRLKTVSGRKLARDAISFMRMFFKRLDQETRGHSLGASTSKKA